MSTEEERAAEYRRQAKNRFDYKNRVEKAFAGDPAARKALAGKTAPLRHCDENGIERAY